MRLFLLSLFIVSVVVQQPSQGRVNKRQAPRVLEPKEPKQRHEPLERPKQPQVVENDRLERDEVPADCCEPRYTPCWFITEVKCEKGEWMYDTDRRCFPGWVSYGCCGRCKCEDKMGKCYKRIG